MALRMAKQAINKGVEVSCVIMQCCDDEVAISNHQGDSPHCMWHDVSDLVICKHMKEYSHA